LQAASVLVRILNTDRGTVLVLVPVLVLLGIRVRVQLPGTSTTRTRTSTVRFAAPIFLFQQRRSS